MSKRNLLLDIPWMVSIETRRYVGDRLLERKDRVLVLEAVLETAVINIVPKTNPCASLARSHLGHAAIVPKPEGIRLLLGSGLTEGIVDIIEKTISHRSLGADNRRLSAVVTTTKEAALVLEAGLAHSVRGGVAHANGSTGLFRNHRADRGVVGFSRLGEAENTEGEKSTSSGELERLGTGGEGKNHGSVTCLIGCMLPGDSDPNFWLMQFLIFLRENLFLKQFSRDFLEGIFGGDRRFR